MGTIKPSDFYYTIDRGTSPVIFKDKNSKFICYAIPVDHEDKVKSELEKLKTKHANANHYCYAYQIGHESTIYRANDDGEPNNSAGLPIYGQIKSFELTNILVVVVRYFGGIKLGISGLINAYKSASKLALESSHIIKKTITMSYRVDFEYKYMSKVMQLLKKNKIDILDQQLKQKCSLFIAVPKSKATAIYNRLNAYFGINITEL